MRLCASSSGARPVEGTRTHYTGELAPGGRTLILVVLAAGIFLALTHGIWLAWIGRFLVRTDPPEKAGIAVVLSGDGNGHRLLKAVELVEQGFAPKVLIVGPEGSYGARESDLAMDFARRRGLNTEILDPFVADITSTLEEALVVDEELRRRGIDKALVVTSEYHSRRSRFIYRNRVSGEVKYLVVASDDPRFDPGAWWKTRAGKEILVIEYVKTLNSWFE